MARKAAKRETISPRGDKRYVRRGKAGRFKESDDQGKSLSQDRRRKAKKAAAKGQGDRGDRKTSGTKRKTTATRRKSAARGKSRK